MTLAAAAAPDAPMTAPERRAVLATSFATLLLWYDFYLYGWTAPQIGATFFAGFSPTAQYAFALLVFAAGFLVRPVGAVAIGRLGDLIGRRYAMTLGLMAMGLSTALVAVLPGSRAIGVLAPAFLIALRMLQGLALGGEYGAAATYVAEWAPPGKRGFYTSFLQATATMGLFLSLLAIFVARNAFGAPAFGGVGLAAGWRAPYLASLFLVAAALWLPGALDESPLFGDLRRRRETSVAPVGEAFGDWARTRMGLAALFGMVAGQAVIWYGGQFYARVFLVGTLKLSPDAADMALMAALFIGAAGFLLFGWLSDRIGRKPIILGGCLLAAATYFPAFGLLTHAANPALEAALAKAPVILTADPADCSLLFDPVGGRVFANSCDVARQALAARSVQFTTSAAPPGAVARVSVGSKTFEAVDLARGGP
ncbi:MAG: MFS transporter, partial [Hyphomicrobiales bacterium]|nr:MFS transporter [Hyphomicrobiales bacterium]